MRDRTFRILRVMALFGLALVLLSSLAIFTYCTFGWSGQTGSGQFLDMVCPMDEPRTIFETNIVLALINRLTMPGIVGAVLLLASGMMAVLFHFALPKEPEAPNYPWPGKSIPKPPKAEDGRRPEW
jgi:hypothetical protein